MNKAIATAGSIVTLCLTSLVAQAGHGYDTDDVYVDYARVLSVKPIYRRIEVSRPHRECWIEKRPRYYRSGHHDGGHGREIIGGIIGGALGSRLGKGKGRKVGAVAGILLGASVANKTRNHDRRAVHTDYDKRRVCRRTFTRHTVERIDGYSVTYRYKGHTGVTRMQQSPGKRIRIRVSIAPEG